MSASDLWSKESLAWLAGLLEGEGCFSLDRGRPRIDLNMTDRDVVERVCHVAGMGNVYGPVDAFHGRYKLSYIWRVTRGADAYALMMAIYPWMHSRRQAKITEVAKKFAECRAQRAAPRRERKTLFATAPS